MTHSVSYGIKIRNYQAAVLYEYKLGIREQASFVEAMLTNSLFLDYLKENGLKVDKKGFTRDVICLQFDFGTANFKTHAKRLKKSIREEKAKEDYDGKETRLARLEKRLKFTEEHPDLFKQRSKQELRREIYNDGIVVHYPDGKDIEYLPLYRSAGKAKNGQIMCIRKNMYHKMLRFLRMGLKVPKHNAPLVELQAYSSLVTSTIVDRIKIQPDEILVIKDVDRSFYTQILSVETDKENHCQVVSRDHYPVTNTLFDGQALIDTSIFPDWAHDYILLRQHFTKCAAFHTDIQLFFKDWFQEDYESAYLTDYWGRQVKASNVKLICTETALKWTKWHVSFDYWAEWLRKNGCLFGIVKTAHPSKIGYELQQASYQIINSLNPETMDRVMETSVDFITRLKDDDDFFLDYLRRNESYANDYEVLLALVEADPEIIQSEYFVQRRKAIISSRTQKIREGKVLLHASNLVIVGSPYAMLLASVGENVDNDMTFGVEPLATQCYTTFFDEDEYLAFMRSPFNGMNNMGYLHNVRHPKLERYFKFGEMAIAVNLIGTDFQSRENGSDQDSDFGYTTNHPDVVEHAKYCVQRYPTIENNVPKETSKYDNTADDLARLDNNIAAGQMDIGLSSNICALNLTYSYNYPDQIYLDNMVILSVLAQIAIDSAKKRFTINATDEIARIKDQMNIKDIGFPKFWLSIPRKNSFAKLVRKTKSEILQDESVNLNLVCPMNYLFDMRFPSVRSSAPTISNDVFFERFPLEVSRATCRKIEKLIEGYSVQRMQDFEGSFDDFLLGETQFNDFIQKLSRIHVPKDCPGVMSWLIDRSLNITSQTRSSHALTGKNRSILMRTLYTMNPKSFIQCFKKRIKNDAFSIYS